MQISVEKSGAIERRVTVSIPGDEVGREIAKRLREVAKHKRIDGFRPGKAPHNLIEKRYGAQVTGEVVNETIHSSYRRALSKEEIVPAGLVSIEPKPFVAGDDLQYVATIELYPEIPSPTLAGRTIEKPVCAVTDEDIARTLEDIRKRHADFVTKDTDKEGKSQQGDRLTIDFVGKIDGQPFTGGSADGHQFVLGEGHVFEGFETELLAVAVGDSKQIAITFPDDYPGADIAGKAAEFAVTVTSVERRILPELDNAFAEKLGIAEGGMEKMREEIVVSLNRELATRLRTVIRARVMNELIAVNPIEAPKSLVDSEIERRVSSVKERMDALDAPQQEGVRERFAVEAREQVTLGLIAREIIEKSEMKADSALVRERIEEMASGYDDGEAMINWYYSDPERLRQVESIALDEQVVARMLETATVTEKKVSLQELMNPRGDF